MLALAALLAFLPQAPARPTSRLMFHNNAPCGVYPGQLPVTGDHTFRLTDGKLVVPSVHGLVQPTVGGEVLVIVFYAPKNVSCPGISLVQ